MAEGDASVISRAEARARGLKIYFTGAPCRRGHVAPRYTGCSKCVECGKIQSADWYDDLERARVKRKRWRNANPDREKRNRTSWCERNRDAVRERARQSRNQDPEPSRVRSRAWYQHNVTEQRRRSVEYRHKNLEERREYSRSYNKRNRPRLAVHASNRRAKKKGNGGRHTVGDVEQIFKAQHGKCACCRTKLTTSRHVDHITPLARGGTDDRRNLQILCAPCNQSKSARDPIEFMRAQGRLL